MEPETLRAKGRIHLRIEGRVQGVYFRASAVQQALRLGITGWVMNRHDGSVEIVAEGVSERLEELIAWCRCGPAGARVEKVDLNREEFRGEFPEFSVRRFSF